MNINFSSASESRRKILERSVYRVPQQDRGIERTSRKSPSSKNVFRIASTCTLDRQQSKSKKSSRGRTSHAKAMSELEVQNVFVRDELDKLCIEEYAEIFENFLVCDDCPEINEAEDGTEDTKKRRVAAWKNNNGGKKWGSGCTQSCSFFLAKSFRYIINVRARFSQIEDIEKKRKFLLCLGLIN